MPGNPYDSVIGGPAAAPLSGPLTGSANPYDELIVGERERLQTQLRATVSLEANSNPQAIVAQRQLAKYVGLPPAVGEALPDEVKQMATVKRVAEDAAKHPALQRAYSDAEFARIGHDDSTTLSRLGNYLKGAGSQLAGSTQSGLLSLVGAVSTTVDALNPFTLSAQDAAVLYKNDPAKLKDVLQNSPATFLSRVSRAMQEGGDEARKNVNQQAKDNYGNLRYATLNPSEAAYLSPVKVLSDVVSSLPTTLALAASAYFTRGQSLRAYETAIAGGATAEAALASAVATGATTMARVSAGTEGVAGAAQQYNEVLGKSLTANLDKSPRYAELIQQGYAPEAAREVVAGETATQAGQIAGVINAVTNWIGGRYLGKLIAEGGALPTQVIKGFAREGAVEFVQSMGEQFGANWAERMRIDPNSPLLQDLLEAGIAGFVVGGATGGAFVAAAGRIGRQQQQVQDAQAHADQFKQALDTAAQSLVRARSPEDFRRVVDNLADGAEVHLDASVFNQLAPELLAQMPESVRQQLANRVTDDTLITVPKADILTVAPGTPLAQFFQENARLNGPDSMSQVEAKDASAKAQEYLQQEAERVLQQAADTQAWQASSESVRTEILGQLNSTGRFTADVNEAYATLQANFFSTMAARVGLTPQELYERYSLKVAAKQVGQGGVLNADVTTPEFREWFGASKVVDTEGKPLVVYHGTNQQIAAFDPARIGARDSGFYGSGFYLTPDENVALDYADSAVEDTGEGEAVAMPLYVSLQNPFIWDMSDEGADATRAALASFGIARDSVRGNSASLGNAKEREKFNRAVREAGFDGVIVRDEDGVQEVVAFRPEQIKSVLNERPTEAPGILEQRGEQPKGKAAVERLTSAAQRGVRQTGTRSVISVEEKAAIEASAKTVGMEVAEIEAIVRAHKLAHPVAQGWAPLTYLRSIIKDDKVTHEYQKTPYDFSNGADGNQLEPGTAGYTRRVNAVARSMVEEVRNVFRRAQQGDANARNILAQAGWYKAMRSRLRQEFGGLGDLFADLLGATSPNTPVRENWFYAVDVLRRASRGDFDTLIPQWEQWADNLDLAENELKAWFNEQLAQGKTKKSIWESQEFKDRYAVVKAAREIPDALLPTKESGAKYGFNGRNIVRAMVDLWRVVKNNDPDIKRGGTAPKALNFSGNLIGFRSRATIDVWAARMLQRLAGGRRIASMAETGVSGDMREDGTTTLQFGFGQDVFGRAAADIRNDPELRGDSVLAAVNDDDLQAVVWFVEKEIWTLNDWTSAAGEGGSFELEASLTGTSQQELVKELRRIIDASPKTADVQTASQDTSAALKAIEAHERTPAVAAAIEELRKIQSGEIPAYKGIKKRMGELEKIARPPKEATALLGNVERVKARLEDFFKRKTAARAELAALEREVDRFTGGLSIQMSADTQGVDFVPTDAEMAQLAERVRLAAYEADHGSTVLGSKMLSTEGRYGSIERSLDLELVTREGYDANRLWQQMLQEAQTAQQDSTFLSRVLRDSETYDPLTHRPGVEIYFRSAADAARLEQMLGELAKEGVEFLTVVVDGRRLASTMGGQMPAAVGVRLQYVPEFEQRYGMDDLSGLDDVALAAKIQGKADELADLANRVSQAVPGVSFAGQFWYETQVAFSHQYQEKIDALTAGQPESAAGATDGQRWTGDTVRAGLESADRQARETAGTQPDGQLLGGDALGTTDGQPQPGELNQETLAQGPRGTFSPEQLLVTLNESADLSTFLHESGHFFLEVMADLASQANTPQQIKDDMAATLKWFGVPDLATWNNYTLDQKRPYHEKWAESFEQYLFEGKAPSQEMQPLFRRFRSWLVNVYKSLTQFMRGRDLKVNDEIRQVFDRLIATDEQIAQAEEAAGLLPDFEATNEAIEALQARSLRDLKWTVNARSKVLKALEKQTKELRKGVEAEVRAEVEQQPLYKAMAWLKKGETTDPATGDLVKAEKGFRLSTAALAEMYPETMLGRPDLTKLRGMTGREGLHPDLVADMFGFESGDALVRNILDAEPIGSVIEGITDQRMLERHGDLATPEAREAAANEAVHNEARARSLATELKSQSEMLNPRQDTGRTAANGRPITVNAVVQAAKEFAANIAARRRLKDLKNAAWQHRSAEARAGKRWQEATAKGDTQAAVQAKRDQVLNNATVKALQEAQVEAKKILEFFKRVTKGNDEKIVKGGRDPDVVNAMRAILAAYDVAPRLEKSALEYMEVVAKNDPAMYAALKPSVDGALINAKPVGEMTMEELRGLNDELRAMWVLAKRSRQMEVDGNLLDLQDAAEELMDRMGEIGIPDQVPGEKGAITEREERGLKLQFAKSILTRVEQWAERLDGKFGGPFLRLVFQPIKDAADRYRTDKVAYRKRFTALLENIAPALPSGPIAAPELGYTFGNARDSGAAELLHAILHTGNDSNKRKLLLGRGWASENADGTLDTSRWDAFIARMHAEGKLTQAHYDFAQGVWDLLEQMKPLAQETHRRVFGRYFAEVTANEFTVTLPGSSNTQTVNGVTTITPGAPVTVTYRGGYVPAQTDSRLVKDAKLRELAEGENESMAYAFPASPSGFTKSRVEYNKPLLLDLRALGQHMDKVLLFSHMQGAVTDVRRLLTDKQVSYALDRIDPGAFEGMLIPWLNRSAKQIVETPTAGDRKLSRFLSASRSRAGMALMFANLSNTVQQLTGFSLAAVKVKPALMMQATAQFTASPKTLREAVAAASPYMENRMLNEVAAMNDAVEDILVNPTLLEKGQAWTNRHAYFLQSAIDNTMSPIIWTAAYNQAVEEGQDAKSAVRFADGVIRQTQGSTLPEDISRFESGPAAARVFTQFIGYFNMMANTNATAMKQIVDEMGLRKGAGKLIYVALAGLLVPIWVAEAIAQAFKGGPEDKDKDGYLDDWLKAVFGLGTLKGLVAQVPLVGQAAQLVVNRFNDNPADDKFSLSPAVSLIESAASSPASVYSAIVDDGNRQKAVRDVAAAATLITGLPIYGVARPLGYLAGMSDSRIEPTGPVDLARGLVTGTASPESKQR